MSRREDPEESAAEPHEGTGQSVDRCRPLCSVCNRLYREPKILPCLHTFCSDCIGQLEPFCRGPGGPGSPVGPLRQDGTAVTVLCPDCDSEVELPPSGPSGLSTDHLALDEVFLETVRSDAPLSCDLCGEGEGGAVSRCDVCNLSLCGFCCQAHRRQKRTALHSLRPLDELRSDTDLVRPVLCSVHPGQDLVLFCGPCDRPVCLECATTLHRDHGCRPTSEVIDHHGDGIRELVSGRLRPLLLRLEDSLQKVDVSQDALQARAEAAAAEVRSFARGYANAVETHCLSLLRRLDLIHVQRRTQLQLQGAQLRQALLDVRGAVDFAERLLSRGSDAEILSARGVTLRRLSGLADGRCEPPPRSVAPDDGAAAICFLPAEPAGEVQGYPVVGVVGARTLDLSKCSVEGEGVQRVREREQNHFTLVCRDSTGEQVTRGGENVLVSVIHKDKKDCCVEATVLDNNDGSYSVTYTPEEAGPYSLWVCVRAQHVQGSPFNIIVEKQLRKHGGTFHCCCFCSSGGAKEARCACAGTMPGGFRGCGHGHRGHPGRPHWSCCGSTNPRSECLPHSVLAAVSPGAHLRTVEL